MSTMSDGSMRNSMNELPKIKPFEDCSKNKSVKFSKNVNVIMEPKNLAEKLWLARTSDFTQRQADKARMERLLTPILSTTHRGKIYQKILDETKK